MNIIFLGTPDFSVASLDALVRAGHRVLAAVTQPDRPRDRGHEVQLSPVKVYAEAHGIPVYQFTKIKTEGEAPLKALRPDIMVTCAYGQILTQNILDIAPRGIINVHGSLLPKYRGAAPIQWAVINGERETGVTIMQTELGVDTGDILYVKKTPIGPNETAGELFGRLSELGAQALVEALALMESGELHPVKQDERLATHTRMLKKQDGQLDWSKSAEELSCLVRGVSPWPGAYTFYRGKMLKVWECALGEGVLEHAVIQCESDKPECGNPRAGELIEQGVCNSLPVPGTVLSADSKRGLAVACGRGALKILTLQEAGGKRMAAADYLRGKTIEPGSVLGDE